ncbi:ImmA/IrrE family metallo-endopeptidase [Enterococcus sp. AZ109]|uniref:ImmA/IrrE family metallo-endopeptidase n=1 Tax=Enterococcus sp. AZ109 TaxID=2774634 RepID=UPI003F214DB6
MALQSSKLLKIASRFGTFNPFALAEYLDFDIEYTNDLPEDYEGLAVSELKVLFLSEKFRNTRFCYFLCAHELVHGTRHNGIQAYYNLNRKTKKDLENEADVGAIALLCNFYLELFPDAEKITVESVANYFDIDDSLYDLIENELRKIINHRFGLSM